MKKLERDLDERRAGERRGIERGKKKGTRKESWVDELEEYEDEMGTRGEGENQKNLWCGVESLDGEKGMSELEEEKAGMLRKIKEKKEKRGNIVIKGIEPRERGSHEDGLNVF